MKQKYENKDLILISCIILFLLEVIFIYYVFDRKLVIYKRYSGVVMNDNYVVLILNQDELELFYKNKGIYIRDKKSDFSIEKVDEKFLKRGGIYYNQVFLNVSISNMFKIGDVVDITIRERSVKSINIFKLIWEV